MIDTPDQGRKPRAGKSGAGDSALEEARLRQQAIGVKLRHLFDEVVNEPVPDEFLEILRRADERKAGGDRT
ncbi:NepR family anti-sigma factor [Brevundimonas subvibrioides]|uniref:anti-sigma T factor NepR n=1 Tax=Brevundimonas subvibrioides TaxID=74313 RepID=UPI0022B2EB8B|nr:NepR family anti-sigma factor [Brevundimonas subvibrioides]